MKNISIAVLLTVIGFVGFIGELCLLFTFISTQVGKVDMVNLIGHILITLSPALIMSCGILYTIDILRSSEI